MSQDVGRPSFTAFWKKGKQKLWPRPAAADPSPADAADTADAADAAEKSTSDGEKTRLRRAQVRRAQIQHRQRKANYTKQLEMDVSELRDLVSVAEKETAALARENLLMREALGNAGRANAPTAPTAPELFGAIDVDDLTVTLSMDGALGAPCLHISSPWSGAGTTQQQQQEQRAVNFILGLEHCCWDHFALGDFGHDAGVWSECERGHALMASAYCMAAAPESVYAQRAALARPDKHTDKDKARPGLHWGVSGISLDSLHGLAASLNPGDVEVTPVQAWFELASRYPVAVLMGGTVLDELQREFNGVVRCVMYGAVIERLAFESIIARVLGPSEGSLWA